MKTRLLKIHWILTALEGLLVLGVISGSRLTDPAGIFSTGLTAKNLLLLGLSVLTLLLAVSLLTRRGNQAFQQAVLWLGIKPGRLLVAALLLFLLQLEFGQSVFYLTGNQARLFEGSYFQRYLVSMLPIYVWGFLFCGRSLFLLWGEAASAREWGLLARLRGVEWLPLFWVLVCIWFGICFTNLGYQLELFGNRTIQLSVFNILEIGLIIPLLLSGLLGLDLLLIQGLVPGQREPGADPGRNLAGRITPWLALGITLLLVIVMVRMDIGVDPGRFRLGDVETTNAPLPGRQMLLVVLLVLLGSWFVPKIVKRYPQAGKLMNSKLVLMILLWSAAFMLWRSAPVAVNYFTDQPRPPTYQIAPASDSYYYEIQAHKLLAGEGLDKFVSHPFYSFLLSILHRLAGDHYLDIYPLQIGLAALGPYLLYALARQLGGEISGWLLAGFYILREYNALRLAETITLVNSQMLMTEALVEVGLIGVLLLSVRYFQEQRRSRSRPLLIGALLGLILLTRIELAAVVIILVMVILSSLPAGFRVRFSGAALLLAGTAAVVLPWMVRNYSLTGKFYIEKPGMIRRSIQKLQEELFPVEPESAGKARYALLSLSPGNTLRAPGGQVEGGLDVNPDQENFPEEISYLETVFNYLRRSTSQSLLYFGGSYHPLGSGYSLLEWGTPTRADFFSPGIFNKRQLNFFVRSQPFWWYEWGGKLPVLAFLPLLAALLLISIGLSRSWNQVQLRGVFPIVVWWGHLAVYALLSGSGGRYIKVVDWIPLLYFGIGLGTCLNSWWQTADRTAAGLPPISALADQADPGLRDRLSGLAAAGLILVGLSLPLIEHYTPPQYSEENLEITLSRLETAGIDPEPSEGNQILLGKALYPKFFRAGERVRDHRRGQIPDQEVPRLNFYLVGSRNTWVSIPLSESPERFPHGAGVLLVGEIPSQAERPPGQLPYFIAGEILILETGAGRLERPIEITADPVQAVP